MKSSIASYLLSVPVLVSSVSAYTCRPLANTYPAPSNSSSDAIKNSTLTGLFANTTIAAAYNTTTFSLNVFSLSDPQSQYTQHYTASGAAVSSEGVSKVDSDTIYRIGSISKAWTVYVWLLAAGDKTFNDPITKYVPELAAYASSHDASNELDVVDWNSITVGALASQLSGTSRDPLAGPQADNLYQKALGLQPPEFQASASSYCGNASAALKFYCNRTDFFTNNLFRSPNIAAFDSPVYANTPYQILAYALQNITGTPFPELFQKHLVEKHGLKATSYTIPKSSSNSVIPVNATTSYYNVDFAESSPFGGYFSTLNDVTIVARAILNSTFLSPATTRKWLKPLSFTAPGPLATTDGIMAAVGAPWEITRAPAINTPLVPAGSSQSAGSKYQTWIYTKTGDIGLYSSITSLIPEFNAGFNILAAGPAAHVLVTNLADLITEAFIPAYFETARVEASNTYTATFTDPTQPSPFQQLIIQTKV